MVETKLKVPLRMNLRSISPMVESKFRVSSMVEPKLYPLWLSLRCVLDMVESKLHPLWLSLSCILYG